MHILTLKLNTTQSDRYEIDRRFRALSHVNNVLVSHAIKLLVQLKYDPVYQEALKAYRPLCRLNKKDLTSAQKKDKRYHAKVMKGIRAEIGLTEYDFMAYIKVCGRQFRKLLSSQQIQKEASRVWTGVERVLFSDGKQLHYKPFREFRTISGKTNLNGARFDADTYSVKWLGLKLSCKLPKKAQDLHYVKETLDHKVKYWEIKRMAFPNGSHYYVSIVLDGEAPKKLNQVGYDVMGIDPGTSTISGVSDHTVMLKELAPDIGKYNKRILNLQQHIDFLRRKTNPGRFNEDGTVKRGRGSWNISNHCSKLYQKLRYEYRRKAAYIKQSHEKLCNELLQSSDFFVTEQMNWKALQKRSKQPTTRQTKPSSIKQKDGIAKRVYKFKRKKRFGRSLNNRAPAMFLSILKRKAKQYDGYYLEVNTQTYKASQYDHTTGTCTKVPLSKRFKNIGGKTVQRDLYSAFLIGHPNVSFDAPDREQCIKDFDHFVKLQNNLIHELKEQHISMKACFGF